MYVRSARFDVDDLDAAVAAARGQIDQAQADPDDEILRRTTRFLMLGDASSGEALSLFFCETREDAEALDRALDALEPPAAFAGRRRSAATYELLLDHVPAAAAA